MALAMSGTQKIQIHPSVCCKYQLLLVAVSHLHNQTTSNNPHLCVSLQQEVGYRENLIQKQGGIGTDCLGRWGGGVHPWRCWGSGEMWHWGTGRWGCVWQSDQLTFVFFFSNLHDSERSYSNFLISRLSSKWTCMVCGIITAGLLSVIGNPLRYAGWFFFCLHQRKSVSFQVIGCSGKGLKNRGCVTVTKTPENASG